MEGLFGEVRGRVFGREPVLRITGRLIFALGGNGIATGVVDGVAAVGLSVAFVGAGAVNVDTCDVVAGTKKRLPRRDGDRGEEINGVFGV